MNSYTVGFLAMVDLLSSVCRKRAFGTGFRILGITLGSTEKYVSGIFTKLGLPDTGGEYRRVLAVLRFLQA